MRYAIIVVMGLALASTAAANAQTASPSPAERPHVTVDDDATVHIPPIVVPPSAFISPEAKAMLHDVMTHPYPPVPAANAPLSEFQNGRDRLNKEV